MAPTTKQYRVFVIGIAAFLLVILNATLLRDNERRLGDDDELRELYRQDRRLHIARNHKFIYIHIPKSGGSTVEESKLFDEKRKLGIGPRSHHPVSKFRHAGNITDDYIFATTIRDPCERFVSAYMYLRHDQRSEAMRKLAHAHGLFNSATAEQFVKSLDEEKWAQLKYSVLHFNPMVKYLMHHDSGVFGMDVVMCQEQWDEGINRLTERLDLDEVPANLLARKRQNVLHRESSCASMDPSVSQAIMDNYAVDACLFGYGSYGQGKFTIVGRNESSCIGSQFDRYWFTKRHKFCLETLRARAAERAAEHLQ